MACLLALQPAYRNRCLPALTKLTRRAPQLTQAVWLAKGLRVAILSSGQQSTAAGLLVLGMGCESGAPTADLLALAAQGLREAGLEPAALVALASIDSKADEPAIMAVAAHYGIPVQFFDAATLERETPRLQNPSELVFSRVGCHGVAEAAALAAAGPEGRLVLPKRKSAFATVAIAAMD